MARFYDSTNDSRAFYDVLAQYEWCDCEKLNWLVSISNKSR